MFHYTTKSTDPRTQPDGLTSDTLASEPGAFKQA